MADVWANSMACHPRATYIIITLQGAAPLGEFTVTIQEPHAILQSVRISSAILKIVFLPYFIFYLYFIYFFVFNAVYALTSGGFRIVSDTLVWRVSVLITIFYLDRDLSFFSVHPLETKSNNWTKSCLRYSWRYHVISSPKRWSYNIWMQRSKTSHRRVIWMEGLQWTRHVTDTCRSPLTFSSQSIRSASWLARGHGFRETFTVHSTEFFGKIGRVASEEVTLSLISAKCRSISLLCLLYASEALPFNSSQLKSLPVSS